MKVGVIGSGEVGKTLASGFLKHGHQVVIGSRTPQKLDEWLAANTEGRTGTFSEAAAFGEVLVLAVEGEVASSALNLAEQANLAGKTILDATNPITKEAPVNGVLKFFTDLNESLMERLQAEFPEANFVKCFNSVGAPSMVNPDLPGGPPSMFICGNNEDSKQVAKTILQQFGWETADMGKIEASRAIEPLCILWCISGFLHNDWTHAFKVLVDK